MEQELQENPRDEGRQQWRRRTSFPERVLYRAVCLTSVASGVIGHRGDAINVIRRMTRCQIQFEEEDPACPLRVVQITGSSARNWIARRSKNEELVSDAQYALIKVFESASLVEVGHHGASVNVFCLLAPTFHVGPVIGKKRQTINSIRERTGASVLLLQPPRCAKKDEILIQITGDERSANSALIGISHLLQHSKPRRHTPKPFVRFHPRLSYVLLAAGNISYAALDRGDYESKKVEFRFVVSHSTAGAIIGYKGVARRALEIESGAFVMVDRFFTAHQERVVTVSSLEDIEFLHSPAQKAVFLVFARCCEAKTGSASFRLLLNEKEVAYLKIVLSEIIQYTGSNMKIWEDGIKPNWIQYGVLEITGEYQNVENGILEVTTRLLNEMRAMAALAPPGNETEATTSQVMGSHSPLDILPHRGTDKIVLSYKTCQIDSSSGLQMRATLELDGRAARSFYGDSSCNVDILREMSGADFEVYVRHSDVYQLTVRISGMPLQVHVALGMLLRIISTTCF